MNWRFPLDVSMSSGAVLLGPNIACDGFAHEALVRVQTHHHADHMDGFETSKGCQDIVTSEGTYGLLAAEYNADLPYRSNIRVLRDAEEVRVGNSNLQLVSSGHMLGAVQVMVELENGMRVGYSGDFQWPMDKTIQVDALVLDSTYGSPKSVREFSQGQCEEGFAQLVSRLMRRGSVHIKAHRGTLQRALQVISDEIGCPVIGSRRLAREVTVYRNFGYTIPSFIVQPSEEATEMIRDGRYVRAYGTGDDTPVDLGGGSKIVLSAFLTRPDTPIVEYSDRAYAVAMSNHADFNGTLDYVRATNARFVVTDNTRGGKGYQLAEAIKQRMGIDARPSSGVITREWGGSPL